MKDSLIIIDNKLKQTSKDLGGTFTMNNDKGMYLPISFEERSINWSEKDLKCLIQIFPTIIDDKLKGWNFWVVAHHYRGEKRFWKQAKLADSKTKKEIINNIDNLLDSAKTFFEKLTVDDLEYVTDLS